MPVAPYDPNGDGVSDAIEVTSVAIQAVGDHFTMTLTAVDVESLEPPVGANWLLLQVLAQNMRYTFAGANPTSSTGFRWVKDLDPALVVFPTGATMQVIAETNGAILQGQWGA